MQVYIDSPLILNGVCLRWKGYINLEKLDGVGGMKYDEDSARVKDHILLKFTSYYPVPYKIQFAKNTIAKANILRQKMHARNCKFHLAASGKLIQKQMT